jgi:diguanylate cyclase (GGDEF)-like protein
MIVKILFLITLASLISTAVLYLFLRIKYKESVDIKNLFAELHGVTSFDDIISILLLAIRARGYKTYGFFKKNATTGCLESGNDYIPVFTKSAATKAFFKMQPVVLDKNAEADKAISERLGKDIVFVPLSMQQEIECWQRNHCNDESCACYRKYRHICWLKSAKRFRGNELENYSDKLQRCFKCECLLPVGIFALKGRKISGIHRFLNKNFTGIIKNSVKYERMAFSAKRDHLTGIMNKRSLIIEVIKLYRLALRYGHPLSLCMLDIDHFKTVNDTHGHQTGDVILKALARLLIRNLRNTDIVARYGGDEFTIVLPDTHKDNAVKVLDKIRQAVQDHGFETERAVLNVTISIGVATFGDDNIENVHDLFKKADIALYHAKLTRNKVRAYDEQFRDIPSREEKAVPFPSIKKRETSASSNKKHKEKVHAGYYADSVSEKGNTTDFEKDNGKKGFEF